CLWIPLRRKTALEGASPIVERYPSPMEVFGGKNLAHQMAHVLPMLRSLEMIKAWEGGRVDGSPATQIGLEPGSTRRNPSLQAGSGPSALRGRIRIQMGGASETIAYAGLEHALANEDLERVHHSDYWPKIGTIVPNARRREQRKQAAQQHVAVVFSRRA